MALLQLYVLFVTYLSILGAIAQDTKPNTGNLQLPNGAGPGLLQIYMSGRWGSISAVNFTKSAADVACHQLGYSGAKTFNSSSSALINNMVWLSGPNCTGDELHILRCQWNNSPCASCSQEDNVVIHCNSAHIWDNPFEGSVHLNGGNIMSMGEVLVYLRGQWGAVCADNFTGAAADSVCRQLEYTNSNGHYQAGVSGDIWLKTFHCSESEPCFTDCYDYHVNSPGITDCSSGTVGVSCEYNSSAVWSAGTDCQNQFPGSITSTFASATPMTTPTSPVPTFTMMSSTVALTTHTMFMSTTVSVTPHSSVASTTSVSPATPTTLPPTKLPTLSKGAIAGIVVGSVAVLGLLVVLFCCIICAKRTCTQRRKYARLPSITTASINSTKTDAYVHF